MAIEIASMRQFQPLLQLAALFDCVEDVQVWVKDCRGPLSLGQSGFSDQLFDGSQLERGRRTVPRTFSERPTTTSRRPSWPISFAWMMSTC